ncbi:transcription factor [Methanophagales archaeon]|nr:MAG: transcription factor [Methanophagales archaeon]
MQNKKQKDKTLECPRCWVTMKKLEVDVLGPNVIVDVCPKCHGTWFDNNELKKVLGNRKLADYLTKHIGTKSESKLVCPRCGGLMDLEYAEDVEIDVCLNCNGAWLDYDELDKLKDKSEAGYTGDKDAKAVEEWEDMMAKRRGKGLSGLFGRLMR